MKGPTSETRENYLRVFILLCITNFCLFGAYANGSYTANEYGYSHFQNQLFPYTSKSNNSEKSLCETNTSSQTYKDEQAVQSVVSRWGLYISLAQGLPLVLSSMMFSSMSDSMGRKPFMFIGAIGIFMKHLLMTLAIVFDWNIYLFVPFTLIEGVCGSWVIELAIAMSVVADITSAGKSRSFYITVFSFVFGIGFSVGTFVSGYIVTLLGYDYSMAASCVVAGIAVVVNSCIPESLTISHRKENKFSFIGNIKDIVNFYTKDDPDSTTSTRFRYITSVLAFFFIMMAKLGIFAIESFYLLGFPYCFTPEKISIFETVKVCCGEIVILVGIKLMQQCMADEFIAVIGTASSIAMFILFGIAPSDIYLYIGVAVGCLGLAAIPILRGIMSKMTPPHKQGVLFGSISVVENICNLTSSVMAGAIYSETVSFYRGTAYLVFAGFMTVALLLFLVMIKDSRKSNYRKDYKILQ
uniref:Proton-coupled folate transporter-like n=1 Tax=Crassostrea virginica TaxID=6565 RepID=A0A8B8DPM7_CRAVI|nr:proton-coupled folate transporter-like [Crassostrea virginica]XP_022330193.1 proton-coupled folate transporter-like [Crassostrea virginica]XP_022330194.1 proton-coupled folate transporter-like [Crassostrea virginica]